MASDIVHEELELLTNTMFVGDSAPILYNLLKDTPYKTILIEDLCARSTDVSISELVEAPVKDNSRRSDLKSWFKQKPKVSS